jgi:ubiquitin carboxyl-terminal hydrolase 14
VSVRGKRVKGSWAGVKLRHNAVLLLIGSAEEAPEGPAAPVVFLEDLSPSERGVFFAAPLPAGLHNLGNTCYMNSCLQLLAACPDLRHALQVGF